MNHHNPKDSGLPQPARRLIVWVSGIASLILVSAVFDWTGGSIRQLAGWAALAAVSGAVKLRFPKIDGSYSCGYIVVLAAIALRSFSEIVALSVIIPMVQSYWRPLKQPVPVQVLFNVFNYILSATSAWLAYHALDYLTVDPGLAARFALGAAVFFLANTGLVSWILSILSRRSPLDVWENSFLLVLPYYVAGAACAGLLVWKSDSTAWIAVVSSLPLLGLLYASSRVWIRKFSS